MAVGLGCDPETSNPVLKRILDDITLRRKLGSLPAKVLPHTGVLRLTTSVRDEVASKPPHEINGRIGKELEANGVGEDLRKKFCSEKHFTTMQRLIFMKSYRQLATVVDREVLLQAAVDCESESEALGVIETCQKLLELHRAHRIARLQYRGLAIAMLRDGRHVIYGPFDYATLSDAMERAVQSYRADFPNVPCIFICSGRVAPKAKAVLAGARMAIHENGRRGLQIGSASR